MAPEGAGLLRGSLIIVGDPICAVLSGVAFADVSSLLQFDLGVESFALGAPDSGRIFPIAFCLVFRYCLMFSAMLDGSSLLYMECRASSTGCQWVAGSCTSSVLFITEGGR